MAVKSLFKIGPKRRITGGFYDVFLTNSGLQPLLLTSENAGYLALLEQTTLVQQLYQCITSNIQRTDGVNMLVGDGDTVARELKQWLKDHSSHPAATIDAAVDSYVDLVAAEANKPENQHLIFRTADDIPKISR